MRLYQRLQKAKMILKYLPFSVFWIVRYCIGDHIKTILDLGCGDGKFTQYTSEGEKWTVSGIELFKEYTGNIKRMKNFKEIIIADIINLPPSVTKKKYDVVLLLQVIEHLKKEDGLRGLKIWEKLAEKRIVISAPVGFLKYDRVEKREKEQNKLQKHLSSWVPNEFKSRGYKVYGQGISLIYGKSGLARKLPPLFWPLLSLFSYLFSPLVFFFPYMATYMIAVKEIEAK